MGTTTARNDFMPPTGKSSGRVFQIVMIRQKIDHIMIPEKRRRLCQNDCFYQLFIKYNVFLCHNENSNCFKYFHMW